MANSLEIQWDAHNYLYFAVNVGKDTSAETTLALREAERTATKDRFETSFILEWGETADEMAANCRRAAEWLEAVSARWPGCVIRTDID